MKWNIFSTRNEEPATEQHTPRFKTANEAVMAIHADFDSAVDRLLKSALEQADAEIDSDLSILSSIGFGSVGKVKKAAEDQQKKWEAERNLIHIRNAQQKYPAYKFITHSEAQAICNRYALLLGDVDRYIGDIPSKNVKEIAQFEKNVARCIRKQINLETKWVPRHHMLTFSDIDFDPFSEQRAQGYKICAPIKDFNTKGAKIDGHLLKVDIPDPVVLYSIEGGYLIVSKWGIEGEDASLTNEKMN